MSKPTTRKAVERKSANRNVMSLKSVKLTDLQRIVLSGAAERADGAATQPERMTEKAAQKLAATLIEKGLVREARAKAGMPVWRRAGPAVYAQHYFADFSGGRIRTSPDRIDDRARRPEASRHHRRAHSLREQASVLV
jgi:hypothetical protein